jgi:hypothetical protein
VKTNRRLVAVAAAALVTLGAGVAAAQPVQPSPPKRAYAHKGPNSYKHLRSVKAPYVDTRPGCTLLTCLTPVNTGP